MGKFLGKASFALFILSLFLMYQETPAAKSRTPKTKAVLAAKQTSAPEVRYSVSMSKPSTHLLEVEMRIRWSQMPAALELKMPVWTPGSYLVREYARHIQDFAVKNSTGGALAWEKINKNTWQINTSGAREVVATYRVYANELTVRTNELNDDHAFWNNAALLMFPKDQLKTPSTLTVKPFGSWRVATGLPSVPGSQNTFRAENYDILYDSPFEVSNFQETTFTVRGKPHRIVMSGEGNYDLKKLSVDVAKIVEEGFKIFGELPYENYTFITNLRGGGGLEHLNSTALQFDRFGFKPESRYKDYLGLVSHEYFHAWNVKRLRPDVLGPFDYENENYTKLLWFAEGGTEYFSGLLLRRAGLITEREYLSGKAASIKALQERPGRMETSLEEASFDAWIKYYRQDENALNNQISYYDKGEIVSMMLDLAIRTASGGAKSLDDVLRTLYNDHFKKGRNYTPQDLQKAAEQAAGRNLDDFFSKYVRGETDIDYNQFFGGIGLQLKETGGSRGRAYIGANLVEENNRLTVRSVPANTPAYEQGLNSGDQILAVDGYRASQNMLQNYIADRKPGDKVRLTIFRFDKLREIDLTLGNDPRREYSIVRKENSSEKEQALYRAYMNAEL
jgi:predicted metalloprotease with PDZ domain